MMVDDSVEERPQGGFRILICQELRHEYAKQPASVSSAGLFVVRWLSRLTISKK